MKYEKIFVVSELPPVMSKEELHEKLKIKDKDPEARKSIIEHNLRLVASRLNRIVQKYENISYEKEDLFSVGTIGLIKSVDTYDITKNIEFSTYSSIVIDNAIFMYFRKNNKRLKDCSLQELLTIDDIFDKGITLEAQIDDPNSDFTLEFEKEIIYARIREIVYSLEEKEKDVILMYFGFENDMLYRQNQMAEILNISQAQVSRRIKKTVKKLKLEFEKNQII